MTALTLEQFRSTKKVVVKGAEWCAEWEPSSMEQTIAEYEGELYICIDGENNYHLVITNQEWSSTNLAELEEILYREWYLPEVAGVPRGTSI